MLGIFQLRLTNFWERWLSSKLVLSESSAFDKVRANYSAGEWSLKRLSIVLNEILSTKQEEWRAECIEAKLIDYATGVAPKVEPAVAGEMSSCYGIGLELPKGTRTTSVAANTYVSLFSP